MNDLDIIIKIEKRYYPLSQSHGRMPAPRWSTQMDLEAVHKITPLRLDDMLASKPVDLLHDIWGIERYVIREGADKGKLRDCFVPRYALNQ